MRQLLTALTFAVVLGALFAVAPAMAQSASPVASSGASGAASGDIFSNVTTKANDLFTHVRNLLMLLGAFGVLGLAAGAFFGKFKWHWAISLLGGLVLVAFVSQILTYFGLSAPPTN